MKLLTLARDLQRRRARERDGLFVAEGVRAVEELLASPLRIRGVLVAPQLEAAPRGAALQDTLLRESRVRLPAVSKARDTAEAQGFPLEQLTERDFRSAAETESPQGVVAIAEIPDRSFEALELAPHARLLVLDGLQDPGNTGTILRTAAAFGITATIALPGTVDLWNAKVVRSAMGAHFRHCAFHTTVDALFAYLAEHDVTFWATDMHGAPLGTLQPPDRLALAVGNEGAGISSALAQRAAQTVALTIQGVESLNVAVAAGIFMYELR